MSLRTERQPKQKIDYRFDVGFYVGRQANHSLKHRETSYLWKKLAETESLVTTRHQPSMAVASETNRLNIRNFIPSQGVADSQG
jgi:hypothetical protein